MSATRKNKAKHHITLNKRKQVKPKELTFEAPIAPIIIPPHEALNVAS